MAASSAVKHNLTSTEPEKIGDELFMTRNAPPSTQSHISITRIPNAQDISANHDEIATLPPNSSTYHIYSKHPCHKLITLVSDPSRDRRSGPTLKEQKAHSAYKKNCEASGLPCIKPDEDAFFIHKPYLAFHMPPHVLYAGNSKHGTAPTVLIHQSCFWRKHKLQLGPSIAEPGVLDPRGVVAWKHNGGDKTALNDDKNLKGYKVRTWRLWGETGKSYVHKIKKIRQEGKGVDPDNVPKDFKPARVDEVVYLRWTLPFSRHTRRYHFQFRGVDFYWKGTGTVRESRTCGKFLRFNHLKLVASVRVSGEEKEAERLEICLGKFTSSVAKQKSGVLELYDNAILRLVEEHVPSLLERQSVEGCKEESTVVLVDKSLETLSRLKKGMLYQMIMATAFCMIMSEKEKRHALIDVILGLAEGGGGAGG